MSTYIENWWNDIARITQKYSGKKEKRKKNYVPVSLGGMKIDAGNADCKGWKPICSILVRGIKSARTLRIVLHIPADYYEESV